MSNNHKIKEDSISKSEQLQLYLMIMPTIDTFLVFSVFLRELNVRNDKN